MGEEVRCAGGGMGAGRGGVVLQGDAAQSTSMGV